MAKKPKTLKEIAIELLEKYEASEATVICEYSTNIRHSEAMLKKEVANYRKMIDMADRKTKPRIVGKHTGVIIIDESQTVETMSCQECKHFNENAVMYLDQCEFCFKECHYEPKDEPTISKIEQVEDDAYFLELMGAVERGEMSDAGANQAYVEYISKRVEESDTPQTERKSCKLELFDDDGVYIEPQTDCAWK